MTLVVVYSVQQSAQSTFSKETIKRMTMIVLMVLIINLCSSQWRDCIASLEQPLSLWCRARGTRFACVLFTAAIPSSPPLNLPAVLAVQSFLYREQTGTLSNPTFHLQISKWEREREKICCCFLLQPSLSFLPRELFQATERRLTKWMTFSRCCSDRHTLLPLVTDWTEQWLGWPTATYNDQQKSTWVSEWVSLSSHVATWWWQSERGRGSRMKRWKERKWWRLALQWWISGTEQNWSGRRIEN